MRFRSIHIWVLSALILAAMSGQVVVRRMRLPAPVIRSRQTAFITFRDLRF